MIKDLTHEGIELNDHSIALLKNNSITYVKSFESSMMIFKNKVFHGRLISLNEDAAFGYQDRAI